MRELMLLEMWVKAKVAEFLKEEKGEVNIVAIVVLIGIAVILAVVFKEQILNLLNTLFAAISGNATNAVTPP